MGRTGRGGGVLGSEGNVEWSGAEKVGTGKVTGFQREVGGGGGCCCPPSGYNIMN